jgi:hypothetical protein
LFHIYTLHEGGGRGGGGGCGVGGGGGDDDKCLKVNSWHINIMNPRLCKKCRKILDQLNNNQLLKIDPAPDV